jgi:hypothetical protein
MRRLAKVAHLTVGSPAFAPPNASIVSSLTAWTRPDADFCVVGENGRAEVDGPTAGSITIAREYAPLSSRRRWRPNPLAATQQLSDEEAVGSLEDASVVAEHRAHSLRTRRGKQRQGQAHKMGLA